MADRVEWGYVERAGGSAVQVVGPGEVHGGAALSPEEWGLRVEGCLIYGEGQTFLAALEWAVRNLRHRMG